MKKSLLVVPLLILLLGLSFSLLGPSKAATQPPKPTQQAQEDPSQSIIQAVHHAISLQQSTVLGYLIFDIEVDQVQISEDGNTAAAYLALVDPETSQIIPGEPGLVMLKHDGQEWRAILPTDSDWLSLVENAPPDLLSEEQKSFYLELSKSEPLITTEAFGGYLLPWEAGKTAYLSQSLAHDRYTPSGSAHFAFDFYVPQTMFRLLAAKPGKVWLARWEVPNNDHSGIGNYIVIEDKSTSPVTYQLYLHLAQESIPVELRAKDAPVVQGQFIGMADNTGQSTGHHLHFQVHTNPYSYWGTSIDITFNDVDINGGRPRRDDNIYSDKPYCRPEDVCNQFRSAYISGNIFHGDIDPPSGGLTKPSMGRMINSSVLHIEGWAEDVGSGLDKTQIISYYGNSWHTVFETASSGFSYDWDVCSTKVPDGPVSLALRIWDNEGNPALGLPGLVHLSKSYPCEPLPPLCTPGDSQVSLFSKPDYSGDCVTLNIGDYPDQSQFSIVGDDNAESILLGQNVLATTFSGNNFTGRSNTFSNNDGNFNDDPVGGNQLSALKVTSRANKAQIPTDLISPPDGKSFIEGSSISLSWRDSGGSTQFQVQLDGPSDPINSAWIATPYWHLGNLSLGQGTYIWKVRARNCDLASCLSAWSQPSSFIITAPPPPLSAASVPFSDNLESGTSNWQVSGSWSRITNPDRAHSSSHSWYYGNPDTQNYSTGSPNSGDLTLRPITLPIADYVLRFWYRTSTESPGTHWDQRWVQISTNGGPYKNVLQLRNDTTDYWLKVSLDLSKYANQSIQVRFHFDTLDELNNEAFEGWYIDDLTISTEPLPTCADSNNEPPTAKEILFDQTLGGVICPNGDMDYFKFNAQRGDRIVLDVNTPDSNPPEGLDLILFLLDSDGKSVLAEHDDEIYAVRLDPHLGYQINWTGTYYVLARLWAHPTYGDTTYTYTLSLTKDNNPPNVSWVSPLANSFLGVPNQIPLTVSADDSGSGISYVEFLYHSGDWEADPWVSLGIDQEKSDGWSFSVDVSKLPEQLNAAFYARVFDWAGNFRDSMAWTIGIDHTAPASSLSSLAVTQDSTAIRLDWSGSDNLSGINYYQLQSQLGSGSWTDFSPNPPGSKNQIWFISPSGVDQGFRLRAVDQAGNQELFTTLAEVRTLVPEISSLCSQPDSWDNSGDDNNYTAATYLVPGDPNQTHNLCNPTQVDRLYDEDWVKFSVKIDQSYIFSANVLSEETGVILELYGDNGTTLLANMKSESFGKSTFILWKSTQATDLYLRIRHLDGRIAGNIVAYQLQIAEVTSTFLPLAQR